MQRVRALLLLLAVPALAVLAPASGGPTGPLLRAVAVTAWACTGWLLLVAALDHVSRLPRGGRSADRLVRRIAPPAVRALVRVAVGASVATTLLTGPAALAEDRTPTVAGSTSDALDWPGLAPIAAPGPVPSPARSSPPPHALPPPAAPVAGGQQSVVPARTTTVVVVVAGDSLWSVAAKALGEDATDRRIAQEWPRWWVANRSVVGDHPDLIHPGDRLTAPRSQGDPS